MGRGERAARVTASVGAAIRRIGAYPVYPAVFLGVFMAQGALESGLPITFAARAISVVAAVALLIQLVGTVAFRNRHIGGYIGLVVTLWLLGEHQIAAALVAIGTFVVIVVVWRSRRAKGDRRVEVAAPTTFLNALSVILLVLTAASFLAWELEGRGDRTVAAQGPTPATTPDIYIILLDGYPRADTLATHYGFDNSAFLEALAERGLDTAERSRSNYNVTDHTLISMLEMRHVPDIAALNEAPDDPSFARVRSAILRHPAAISHLKQFGYTVRSISSTFPSLAIGVDEVIDSGHLNGLEIAKLVTATRQSPFSGFVGRATADFLADQHRGRIESTFATLEADPGRSPQLVFAHVMSPHTPFVFGPNGQERPLQPCYPTCGFWDGWVQQLNREDFHEAAVDQIQYINKRVLAAIDAIQRRAETPPVIIVMSDHGTRLDPFDPDEMLRNFFAAATPGHPGLFEEETTPISIFPRLLNAYFDAGLPEPPPLEFLSPSLLGEQGPLRPYPGEDGATP